MTNKLDYFLLWLFGTIVICSLEQPFFIRLLLAITWALLIRRLRYKVYI